LLIDLSKFSLIIMVLLCDFFLSPLYHLILAKALSEGLSLAFGNKELRIPHCQRRLPGSYPACQPVKVQTANFLSGITRHLPGIYPACQPVNVQTAYILSGIYPACRIVPDKQSVSGAYPGIRAG